MLRAAVVVMLASMAATQSACLQGCNPPAITPISTHLAAGHVYPYVCRHAGGGGFIDFAAGFWEPTTSTSCEQWDETQVDLIDANNAILTTSHDQSFSMKRYRGTVYGLCAD